MTLCVCMCVLQHEDMSATDFLQHILKEAKQKKKANVVSASGDEVTSAKATTPS